MILFTHPLKKGFTLIETLIATVIAVVVIGAGATANLTIQRNLEQGEERLQMNALAAEALDNLRFLRDYAGVNFASTLNFSGASSAFDATERGTLVSNRSRFDSGCSLGSCPETENGGPIVLDWCGSTEVPGCGKDYLSPVTFSECPSTPCLLKDTLNSSILSAKLGSDSGVGGDLVGVRRKPFLSSEVTSQEIADVGQYLTTGGAYSAAQLNADDKSDKQLWNFYIRQIMVTRVGRTSSSGRPATDAAVGFQHLPIPESVNAQSLRSSMYVVKVIIQNYHNPQRRVQKSAYLFNND